MVLDPVAAPSQVVRPDVCRAKLDDRRQNQFSCSRTLEMWPNVIVLEYHGEVWLFVLSAPI